MTLGCDGGDDLAGVPDRSPPRIEIEAPEAGQQLRTASPTFVVRISDDDEVFVATMRVTIDGEDYSEAFANAYDPRTGEIRVAGGVRLEDGLQTMIVRVLDRAGNVGEARVQFSVNAAAPPPGPAPT